MFASPANSSTFLTKFPEDQLSAGDPSPIPITSTIGKEKLKLRKKNLFSPYATADDDLKRRRKGH